MRSDNLWHLAIEPNMDQNRRRRFVLVALAIWALTIPFLSFLEETN